MIAEVIWYWIAYLCAFLWGRQCLIEQVRTRFQYDTDVMQQGLIPASAEE